MSLVLSDIITISVHYVQAVGADANSPVWDKQEATDNLWFRFPFKVREKETKLIL